MELIIIFIIIVIAISSSKKEEEKKKKIYQQKYMGNTSSTPNTNYSATAQTIRSSVEKLKKSATEIWNEALAEVEGTEKKSNEEVKAQILARRAEQGKTTILQRAKSNAEEKKEDVTLQTMEAEHKHSERVSKAEHHHPEDIIPENMLGSLSDLMIKGYDGNLCFERDFVAEGLDMISHFTVPSEVPDFSKREL